jgi:hypothetical protein
VAALPEIPLTTTFKSRSDRRPLPHDAERILTAARDFPIRRLLEDVWDIHVPDSGHKSWKDHCPFDFEHVDSGVDRAMRVYPDANTAHCFAMHGFMNPISLIQRAYDLQPIQAARRLLDMYDLNKPRTFEERFTSASTPRPTPEIRQTLAAALHEALSGHPLYEQLSLDPGVLSATEAMLNKLDHTPDDILSPTDWLDGAVRYCMAALRKAHAPEQRTTHP